MKFSLQVDINSGAALCLFVLCYFALIAATMISPAVERVFPTAIGGLLGGFTGFLVKRNSDNRLDLEAARSDLGPRLNEIKLQAAGQAGGPCPPDGDK